jgi:hypothetical protein
MAGRHLIIGSGAAGAINGLSIITAIITHIRASPSLFRPTLVHHIAFYPIQMIVAFHHLPMVIGDMDYKKDKGG